MGIKKTADLGKFITRNEKNIDEEAAKLENLIKAHERSLEITRNIRLEFRPKMEETLMEKERKWLIERLKKLDEMNHR